jgi:hypothetical protein
MREEEKIRKERMEIEMRFKMEEESKKKKLNDV